MTNDAPEGKPCQDNYALDSTVVDVYGSSARDPSTSVCKWIDNYRGGGTPKDLYLSDDTEGRFQKAIKEGAKITKESVRSPNRCNGTEEERSNTGYVDASLDLISLLVVLTLASLNDSNPIMPPSLPHARVLAIRFFRLGEELPAAQLV